MRCQQYNQQLISFLDIRYFNRISIVSTNFNFNQIWMKLGYIAAEYLSYPTERFFNWGPLKITSIGKS